MCTGVPADIFTKVSAQKSMYAEERESCECEAIEMWRSSYGIPLLNRQE